MERFNPRLSEKTASRTARAPDSFVLCCFAAPTGHADRTLLHPLHIIARKESSIRSGLLRRRRQLT